MENGFRAFHRAKICSKDTSKHCWLHCLPKTKSNTLRPYTCSELFVVQIHVGTALIVFIWSLRPQAHVIATLYLFPELQNCVDLSIKHNIDLVSTEYPLAQNNTWFEKVKRIFKIVKNNVYALFKT